MSNQRKQKTRRDARRARARYHQQAPARAMPRRPSATARVAARHLLPTTMRPRPRPARCRGLEASATSVSSTRGQWYLTTALAGAIGMEETRLRVWLGVINSKSYAGPKFRALVGHTRTRSRGGLDGGKHVVLVPLGASQRRRRRPFLWATKSITGEKRERAVFAHAHRSRRCGRASSCQRVRGT